MATRDQKLTNRTRQRESESTSDSVALYMRDVEQRARLSREEETALVRDMIRRREEIAEFLRAVLLKACDTLHIEGTKGRRGSRRSPADILATSCDSPIEAYVAELQKLRRETASRHGTKLRAAIAGLVDKVRLRNLEAKILSVAELARKELQALAKAVTSQPASSEACRLLRDIAASFGVSAEDIQRVAAAIAERRSAIEHAKRRLVESNLRLVVYFARRSKWRGAEMADLIQEGNIALMNAVDSFDPDRGLPFGTFATIGVRRAIHRFGANAADMVRVPNEVRLRRRRVRGAVRYLSDADGNAPSWDDVAAYLELPKSEVAEAFEYAAETISLDDGTDEAAPIANVIANPKAVDAENVLASFEEQSRVRDEVANLDERSRRIIEDRYAPADGDAPSLADIGRALGVTRERARQIESAALRVLRTRGSSARGMQSRRARQRTAHAF